MSESHRKSNVRLARFCGLRRKSGWLYSCRAIRCDNSEYGSPTVPLPVSEPLIKDNDVETEATGRWSSPYWI